MRPARPTDRVHNAMKLTRLYFFAALLAAPLSACNCSEDPLTPAEGPRDADPPIILDGGLKADAEPADTGEPPDTGIPEGRELTFDGPSPLTVFYSAQQDLRFILTTESGAFVPQATINFAISGTAGVLSAMTATTDANGRALVRFTAGTIGGASIITATADYAQPEIVEIHVGEDPNADLIVDVASGARIAVTDADAMIYVGPVGTVPTCAQLLAAAMPPVPTFTGTYSMLPGSSTFTALQTGSSVSVLATGTNADGVLVARGCTDGARLVGGTATHVLVTLQQLPAELDGDYDALLLMDIGQTLPPPYGPTIVLITDFLADPAGWVVYQTLAALDDQIGSTFLEWTPPTGPARRATFPEVRANPLQFGTWEAARDLLENFLITQFGQTYVDLTTIGGDISHAIRSFEVGAGYTLTSTGAPGRVEVTEEWKAFVFQWQYGCPAGDLGCARRAYQLSGPNAHLAPAQAMYGATINYTPTAMETERYSLTLDPHTINIRYGAIVLLVLNTIVFPNLPPPLAGNNLTDVIGNIASCPAVATSLANATGFPASFFQSICDAAVIAAATYIENQILGLDSVNNPGLIVGLSPSGGGEMILVDHDRDLATELVESFTTYASWSNNQNNITPIIGDGRRAATQCTRDADCLGGTVCSPIASYLKVRATENDCRHPRGTGAGTSVCAVDADCASGLCFNAGGPSPICFAACATPNNCAVGTCVADVLSLDLNSILMGLGDSGVDACVP